MGHLIQLLGDIINQRSLQSTLSPNRRAITKDYFTDRLGSAIVMKHDNPGKEIVKPFHIHARLLSIATTMGFFYLLLAQEHTRQFFHENIEQY